MGPKIRQFACERDFKCLKIMCFRHFSLLPFFGQKFRNHTYKTLLNDLYYFRPRNGSEINCLKRMISSLLTESEYLERCLKRLISKDIKISFRSKLSYFMGPKLGLLTNFNTNDNFCRKNEKF